MASRVPHRVKGPGSTPEPAKDDVILDQDLEQDNEEAVEEDADRFDLVEAEADVPRGVAVPRRRSAAPTEAAPITRRPLVDSLPRWIPKYFREALIELSKVTWPTRQEAFTLTLLVIGLSIVFAVIFGLVDLGLFSALRAFTDKVLTK